MNRPKAVGETNTGLAFKAQMAAKSRVKAGREEAAKIKDAREAESKALREKREAKQKRRAENTFSSANYQVVRVTFMVTRTAEGNAAGNAALAASLYRLVDFRPHEAQAHVEEAAPRHQAHARRCEDRRYGRDDVAQIAADRLRVGMDAITIRSGDSATVPPGVGTFGSRSIAMAGSAIAVAADQLTATARERARSDSGCRSGGGDAVPQGFATDAAGAS